MAKKKQEKSKNIPPQYKEQKPLIQAVEQPKSAFFKENWLPIAIIVFFSIALYIQTVTFDYALDDTMVIVKNKFTQRGFNGIGDIFKYESFRGYFGEQKQLLEGDRYRPLSIATFAAEQSLFGGNKAISHFINILLYVLTGILLFRVLLFMQNQAQAPQPPKGETSPLPLIRLARNSPFGGRGAWAWAAMATLLFIVHPLHVEVVANIKGRDDIIAFMGEMGALYFTFKYLNDNKFQYLIYSFLSFCVGVLSKESAITFLAIVPLTAHFFTNASFSQKVKVTLPIIAATIFYLILRLNAIGYLLSGKEITDLMNNPFFGMTFGEKTATIFYTLLMYLKLHIFPHPLTHDYYPYQIPKMAWSDWQAFLSLAIHIGLLAVILRGWKKRSIYAYAAAFYLITLSIVSNLFVSVGTFMNERFAYHASLGFCIAIAYFLSEKINTVPTSGELSLLKNEANWRKIAIAMFALLVVGFSAKTLMRVPDWYSEATLNNSAIKYSPNSARANCFYAVSMWENTFNQLPKETPEVRKRAVLDSMNFYFNKSVSILPKYGAAQKMRAAVAAEYHILDGNVDALIKVFDEVNRSGTYDAYVIDYLKYVTTKVKTKADAEKLVAFYSSMIVFYKQKFSTTTLPSEYTKLLEDVQARMINLQ